MIAQLDDLHQAAIRRMPGDDEATFLELAPVFIVELEAMAMAFEYEVASIGFRRTRARLQDAGVDAEAHRAAFVRNVELVGHEIDHRMFRRRIELRRIGILGAKLAARQIDTGALHPQAQAEVRDPVLAGITRGDNLALYTAVAETTRDHDSIHVPQQGLGVLALKLFRRYPFDLDVHALCERGVPQGFGHGDIRILELYIFANQGDREHALRLLDHLHQMLPILQVRGAGWQAELTYNVGVEAGALKHQRNLVDRLDRRQSHDGLEIDIAEERDLLANLIGHLVIRAADQDIRRNTDAPQLHHRVLRRLGLKLSGRADHRQKRHMHVEDVVPAGIFAHLPDRLEKRQALDIADGTADLDDDHVRAGCLRHGCDP